jgi:hypothetical protein
MNRRLTLKSEHLSVLGDDDLAAVNGAAALPTIPLDNCFALTFSACERLSITCLTGYYPSLNAPCTTP